MSQFYPDIDQIDDVLWALTLIIKHQRENDEYLLDENCPYPSDFVEMIVNLIEDPSAPGERPVVKGDTDDTPEAVWEGLEVETQQLYLDLKTAKSGLKRNDSSGQMSFFRTATTLLEKLVGLRERASGLKELHEFKDQAFKVIDSVLNDDQRNTVLAIFRRQAEETDK